VAAVKDSLKQVPAAWPLRLDGRKPKLRNRKRLPMEQRTYILGGVATLITVAAAISEWAHVWRKGSAPLPTQTDDVVGAAEEAARETVEVAVRGYRAVSNRENALFNLLMAFSLSFAMARTTALAIRQRGRLGPFRDVTISKHRIHHFIPGIVMAFITGGAAVVTRSERLDRLLALPFGIGVGLTLDEAALLLELEDVYWSPEGVVGVEIALTTMAFVGAMALSWRLFRRGERRVLN